MTVFHARLDFFEPLALFFEANFMPAFTRLLPLRSSLALFGTMLLLSSCTPVSGPAGTEISREAFIATYADLRLAVLASSDGELPIATRDSILDANGVTGDQLLEFATVHGPDAEYMREIWIAVGNRMDGVPDSAVATDAEGAQRD